jgi:ankyrin repeat protein
VKSGNIEIVKLLLEHGAQDNEEGWTPWHTIAKYGHIEIYKLLITHATQERINHENDEEETTLYVAV